MPHAAIALLLTLLSLAAAAQPASSLAPRVRVETTEGDFVMELDAVRAPLTAENFLRYVRDGAYDGTVFHRVIPNFVVQGGGFDEQLAPRTPRAPIPNESGNGLSNRRGTVGLAREDSPHSGSVAVLLQPGGQPRTRSAAEPLGLRGLRPRHRGHGGDRPHRPPADRNRRFVRLRRPGRPSADPPRVRDRVRRDGGCGAAPPPEPESKPADEAR